MSTTLTNGLKLPDKGSVDWYADMQNNYAILDGAVGTIAEHTSALSGKAPLVHTHTKADITDFPAYGNAAGTICEGNDSRLSDARTPVAHTHTKSDVTDLLNSDFIPSANNAYDLGSSSYQWKSVYAQNYYYNGVAWGLDKANTWTNSQTIASSSGKLMIVQDTTYELGQAISSGDNLSGYAISDKNNTAVALIDVADRSYGDTQLRIRISQKFDENSNNRSTSGTTINNEILVGIGPEKQKYVTLNGSLKVGTNNAYDLGTSTKKWKTLNGVNPGALSLPDKSKAMGIDTTNFAYGSNFTFTPTVSGWLFVSVTNCTKASLKTGVGEYFFNQSSDHFRDTIPVIAGEQVTLLLFSTATSKPVITLFPCQGNVNV